MGGVEEPIQRRKGMLLRGQLIDLRGQEVLSFTFDPLDLPDVKELYERGRDDEVFDEYYDHALSGRIVDPDDLFYVIRSILRLRKAEEAFEILFNNRDIVYQNRNLLYEMIILSSKSGNISQMYSAINRLDTEFGILGVHSKVLQSMLISRLKDKQVDEYIEKMKQRFKRNSSYEILRAAFNSKSWDLALKYVGLIGSSPRERYLALRTLFRTGKSDEVRKLISKMNWESYSNVQILEIIRIGLRVCGEESIRPWLEKSNLDKKEVEIEIARSQYYLAVEESNFEAAFSCFQILYDYEEFNPNQILNLVRSSTNSPEKALNELYNFGLSDPFILSCVAEISVKFNRYNLAESSFGRLQSMVLCSDKNSNSLEHYLRAVYASSSLRFLNSAYSNMSSISNYNRNVIDFVNYYDRLISVLGDFSTENTIGDEDHLECRILRHILESRLPKHEYIPHANFSIVVNNSIKFGGAERQVVRCLSCPTFSKSLVVWNKNVNTSSNSFIDEVIESGVEILDYSISKIPAQAVYTQEIQEILSLIPTTSPLNPGVKNKIRNLIEIILQKKPQSLHLWQDTTSVLGAVAGLIAGVPRIVMSARSLPPFADPNSTFENKGPNYYYNNRYTRGLYKSLLKYDNVFLCHNSENGLQKYIEWLGGYEEKMLLLRNGFDFSSLNVPELAIKGKNTKITIGSVFRFVEVKRPLLWLDAAYEIKSALGDKVQFRMIGDGPLFETAINYAEKIGLEDDVEFMGYRDDVNNQLKRLDIFMLTSSIEGLPNVLIEAQSMGIPVVSTNVGGARETFIDSISGKLVHSSDPVDLAHAVIEVLESDSIMNHGGEKGKDFVESRFGVKKMYEQLHHILFEDLT